MISEQRSQDGNLVLLPEEVEKQRAEGLGESLRGLDKDVDSILTSLN